MLLIQAALQGLCLCVCECVCVTTMAFNFETQVLKSALTLMCSHCHLYVLARVCSFLAQTKPARAELSEVAQLMMCLWRSDCTVQFSSCFGIKIALLFLPGQTISYKHWHKCFVASDGKGTWQTSPK